MSHTLTAKEQSLAKIFSDDYVFTIPGYQRPYAWGRDQAQELLDDLLGALNSAPTQLSDAAPYFLGSIVLIKAEAMPEATVVDGQQRLTTLTLLLSAIRATVGDDELQKDITGCIYEKGSLVKGTQARYRLLLRERDRDFFRQYVQHENGLQALAQLNTLLPDAQARLRNNAQVFMDGLAKLPHADVVRLVQFVITRCYLVTVATPDLDSAYRIFGVLNSRGLDLSATDILKAEIIGGIEPALRDAYTKKWEDEEEDLGRDEFGDLFSHIRMVYRKAKPQGTLLKEFKEHVVPARQPRSFVDEVLLPMAQAFAELRDADYASTHYAEQVNEHLRWLNRLEFKDWVPPALTFFVRHRQQPAAVLDFFRDLERLAYSMLARRAGVNDRIERFSALTNSVEAGGDLSADTSPLQLSPEEQHHTYSALNGPLYDTHSPRALALLLLRLDHLLSDGSASYQHEVVSVEHVMPQQPAPNSQWATHQDSERLCRAGRGLRVAVPDAAPGASSVRARTLKRGQCDLAEGAPLALLLSFSPGFLVGLPPLRAVHRHAPWPHVSRRGVDELEGGRKLRLCVSEQLHLGLRAQDVEVVGLLSPLLELVVGHLRQVDMHEVLRSRSF